MNASEDKNDGNENNDEYKTDLPVEYIVTMNYTNRLTAVDIATEAIYNSYIVVNTTKTPTKSTTVAPTTIPNVSSSAKKKKESQRKLLPARKTPWKEEKKKEQEAQFEEQGIFIWNK